jgi:hypothetical protein
MTACRWSIAIAALFATRAMAASGARTISGVVTDKRGNLLPGAVVEIDNSITKDIQSYLVQQDGRYHFNDLNPDVEFVLHAHYKGHDSKNWTLSKFTNAKTLKVDFIIPID